MRSRLHWLSVALLTTPGCTERRFEDSPGHEAEPEPAEPQDAPPPAPMLADATIEATTPLQQSALAGSIVASAPSIRVLVDGRPTPGATVRFEAQDVYGGAVSVTQAQTDANGSATAQTWELGPYHATYVVVASLPGSGAEPVEFYADTTSTFELVVHGLERLEPEAREQVDRAVRRWQGAVIEPLATISGALDVFAAQCEQQAARTPIEHSGVHVFLAVEPLVGAAGRGGPCVLRDDGSPAFGRVFLDSGIVGEYARAGALESLMLHELGHVLGVGTLWAASGLLRDPAGSNNAEADPFFAGPGAQAQFEALRPGSGYEGPAVPVEDRTSLEGSVNAHWRESVVGSEAMSTSRVSLSVAPPLSALTIASIDDLGFYTVNMLAADPWWLPVASVRQRSRAPERFGCDPLPQG